MGNEITFILPRPAEAVLHEARLRMAQNGGTFEGDAASGTFVVKGVQGNYEIQGTTLIVTVTKKPFLIPMGLVESIVRSQFKGICGPTHA